LQSDAQARQAATSFAISSSIDVRCRVGSFAVSYGFAAGALTAWAAGAGDKRDGDGGFGFGFGETDRVAARTLSTILSGGAAGSGEDKGPPDVPSIDENRPTLSLSARGKNATPLRCKCASIAAIAGLEVIFGSSELVCMEQIIESVLKTEIGGALTANGPCRRETTEFTLVGSFHPITHAIY